MKTKSGRCAGGLSEVGPIGAGAQALATHLSANGLLDRGAVLSRHPAALAPVADQGLLFADGRGQGGDAADNLDGLIQSLDFGGDGGVGGFHRSGVNHVRDYSVNTNVMTFGGIITNVNQLTETFADRLREARKDAGLTQAELARKAGLGGQSTIGNIENGRNEGARELLAIAAALNVNPVWLKSGRGKKEPAIGAVAAPDEDDPDYPPIRRVRFKLSAGIAGYAIEFENPKDGPPMYFHRSWYERNGYDPTKLFAFKIGGRSMEPGMHDADTVVANTGSIQPKDGICFAVNFEGELVVKRLVKIGEEWIASSDNPDKARYRDKPLTDRSFIIGEIVHKQSERI